MEVVEPNKLCNETVHLTQRGRREYILRHLKLPLRPSAAILQVGCVVVISQYDSSHTGLVRYKLPQNICALSLVSTLDIAREIKLILSMLRCRPAPVY